MIFRRKKPSKNSLSYLESIDKDRLPVHIAIIMDGNGRWAKKRSLPRTFGHKAGVETIREVVKAASNLGIKFLTLYAFSTENWRRPAEEVNILMSLLIEYLRKEVEELHRNNVIVSTIGDISGLPEECQMELKKSYEKTKGNTGLQLNLALNYGSRDELKKAICKIALDVKSGRIESEAINEELISNYLFTSNIPDPDLVIRPSGEYRISNFLLWQIAYSEFWFTDIYWPDFRSEHLYKSIIDYQNRDRRFGGVRK